jgi:Uma2 family endonuclease
VSTTLTKLTTADELYAMPDDGVRYELVKGDLIRMSPAGDEHGRVTMSLAGPLHHHVLANKLGVVYAAETGFLLESDPDTVRAPDIAFVTNERLALTGTPRSYRGCAPDLVVEVLSHGNTVSEVEAKVAQWLQADARMVWVVSPKLRTITVCRSLTDTVVLTASDTLDGGDVVPGFQIPVADLFQSR